jgi:hypothetical protein
VFEPTSRYYAIEVAILTLSDGRTTPYKRRRFLPQAVTLAILTEANVMGGDRLDLIAYRTLGAAEQFWQVCDANNAMNPTELTEEVGRVLRIPMPQGQV